MHTVSPLLKTVAGQGKRVSIWLIFTLGLASVLFLHYVNPVEQLAWLRCPVNLATGFYCPGCGSLRAIHAMLNGDVIAALSYNVLAVLVLPLLTGIGIRSFYRTLKGESTTLLIRPWLAWSVFWSVILFTVLRNLPFDTFHVLHP